MGGHPLLAPIRLVLMLRHLHILPHYSVLGGMASTTANARSMSVFPWLHEGGTSPMIMGGSSIPPPPTTLATTIIAMAALLRIVGGICLSNFLCQCMGSIKLLFWMYPYLCTVVHSFPRAMGGIPVWQHQLPQAWHLQACCITLLCCRTITVPPLGLTLPCHFLALVEAYFLLSCTIPVPPKSFHLPPRPFLLTPLLLRQRCSSSTQSRMRRLTWMLWESLSSNFGTPIFYPALQTACLLLPLPTLKPAASGRVNLSGCQRQ
jgi:hypothetical protein